MRTIVSKLRRKLGDDADNPTYIFTEPRVGYRMPKGETRETETEDGRRSQPGALGAICGHPLWPTLSSVLIIFPCLSYSYPTVST